MENSCEKLEAKLEEALPLLARPALSAGENISLLESSDGLSISAGNSLPAKFKRWILAADEKLQGRQLLAGDNVRIEYAPDSVRIHAGGFEGLKRGVGAGGGQIDHPFKVELAGPEIVVHGRNAAEGRLFMNLVGLGQERLEAPESRLPSVAEDSWVFLEITQEDGEYSLQFKCSASLPEQSNGTYIVPIAFVKTEDGKPSGVGQLQFGQVDAPSRIL
jgi:hypothetical protein